MVEGQYDKMTVFIVKGVIAGFHANAQCNTTFRILAASTET